MLKANLGFDRNENHFLRPLFVGSTLPHLRKNRVLVVVVKHLNTLWLITVAVVLIVIGLNPDILNRDSIAGFLDGLGPSALIVYIGISLARALLMMP